MTPLELLTALESLRDYLNSSGHAHLDALKRAVETNPDQAAPLSLPSPAVDVPVVTAVAEPEPFRPLNAPKKRKPYKRRK